MKIQFGSGFLLITALLCIFKVAGILNIPWIWCFCLFWLPFALLFILLGVLLIIAIPFIIIALFIEFKNL